jgi:hypothetical protein
MEEERTKSMNLLDTTDCLEAMGVFRWWKNVLFVVAVLCLLPLQAFFWFVNVDWVKIYNELEGGPPAVVATVASEPEKPAAQPVNEPAKTVETVGAVPVEPNQQTTSAPQPPASQKAIPYFNITIKLNQLIWLIRFFNFLLVPVACFYCLTLLFSLKISMLGRLGGINHISKAFFLSLLMLVLLLPWQKFFPAVIVGMIYTPEELLNARATVCESGCSPIDTTLYYLRFAGYWLLIMLLLVFAQFRSTRWARSILRRLEVIAP